MSDAILQVERRGAVDWVTLNRPQQLNALTPRLAAALADYFAAAERDETLRVVVLRGAGAAFCAGLDIKAFSEGGGREPGLERLGELVCRMRACPQPIVAAVRGAACGGGFALALAADLRIFGRSARMNAAFVKLGLSGCELGLSYFLPRFVGLSVASELMMTGRFLDAQRAYDLGLAGRVVDDADLDAEAQALVDELLAVSPDGLRQTKRSLGRLPDNPDLESVIRLEGLIQAECMHSPHFAEGLRAFVEKRPPVFAAGEAR